MTEGNISVEKFGQYGAADNLGTLTFPNGDCYVPTPRYQEMLRQYGGSLNLFDREYQDTPFYINLNKFYSLLIEWKINGVYVFDHLVGALAFGSAVKFPGTEVVKKRKYLLFGKQISTDLTRAIQPKDADFFLLTDTNLVGERLVKAKTRAFYGEVESSVFRAGIHLATRGIEQFQNGVQAGDTVSISAAKEGIPVLYTQQLHEVLSKSGIARETPYKLIWDTDSQGKLNGNIR